MPSGIAKTNNAFIIILSVKPVFFNCVIHREHIFRRSAGRKGIGFFQDKSAGVGFDFLEYAASFIRNRFRRPVQKQIYMDAA